MELAEGLTPGHRFRCDACGNLTRFDVDITERQVRYWHADLAGEGQVEQSDTVEQTVNGVSCRWCGTTEGIQVVKALVSPSEA